MIKFFEVEKNEIYESSGMIHTYESITKILRLVDPKLGALKFEDDMFRFRADLIEHAIPGKVFWTNDFSTPTAKYLSSNPQDFFKTENGEFYVTGTNLDDILIGSMPAKILSPLTEQEGYSFAETLLTSYNKVVNSLGPFPKGPAYAILLLDLLVPLAEDTPKYLCGLQNKWNDHQPKPELFILTGER